MWWLVLDLAVIVIIGFFVYRSYKKGFARTVLELAAFIVAYVISSTFSGVLAQWSYDAFLEKSIEPAIHTAITETTDSALDEVLPDYIVNGAKTLGIYDGIVESQRETAVETADTLCNNVVRPVVINIVRMILSVVMFTVLLFVLRFAVRAVDKVFRLPLIGGVNRALGALVGFIKGGIVVVMACFIISAVMLLNDGNFWVFTNENIEKTYLFKYIYNINPFLG